MIRLLSLALIAAVQAVSLQVQAQEYPTHPVKIVVGSSAGSGPDIQARTVGNQLAKSLGQAVIIENRPGANQTLAARTVAQSEPDGYTLSLATSSITPAPYIYKKLGYSLVDDLQPIATVGILDGLFLLVDAKSPIMNVAQLIAYAKKERVLYGSPGVGNINHLAAEMFAKSAGVSMQHVPYKGTAEVMAALLGGSMQMMFATPPSVIGLVKAGRVRVLAFTGTKPFPAFPNVPLMKDVLPGYDPIGSWGIILAPAKTPPAIIAKLNTEIHKALLQPAVANIMQRDGYYPDDRDVAQTTAFFRKEVARMGDAVRAAGIKPF